MSYSRWGSSGSGHWYTYWCAQPDETENRDTAIFEICAVASFTAKQLRDNLSSCMAKVRKIDSEGDISELCKYIAEFLYDINNIF